jgi:hypothetical protein
MYGDQKWVSIAIRENLNVDGDQNFLLTID